MKGRKRKLNLATDSSVLLSCISYNIGHRLAAARRRVLGTSSRHTATLEEEERVWHTLNEQLSPASHFSTARRYSNAQSSRKRRQSMRSRPSVAAGGADSEYEHGSEEPSASTRTSPVIKRRRVASVDPFASATPSKPLSKMTKAEVGS